MARDLFRYFFGVTLKNFVVVAVADVLRCLNEGLRGWQSRDLVDGVRDRDPRGFLKEE